MFILIIRLFYTRKFIFHLRELSENQIIFDLVGLSFFFHIPVQEAVQVKPWMLLWFTKWDLFNQASDLFKISYTGFFRYFR